MLNEFPRDPDEWEKLVLANAVLFTTCVFSGRGNYNREEHKTLQEARDRAAERHGTQGRRAMVYAVTECGREVLVPNEP